MLPLVTIAIIAKNSSIHLDKYLECLLGQTYPKDRTLLYIRTNDNIDDTELKLSDWVKIFGKLYHKIYFNSKSVDPSLKEIGNHEWTSTRFKVLGIIRQASVKWAEIHRSHYFTCDVDCYIIPETIQSMVSTGLPIVAPFLKCTQQRLYSNMHAEVDEQGFLRPSEQDLTIWIVCMSVILLEKIF